MRNEIENINFRKGGGCGECNGTGYKGRQGIYEVLRVTAPVEEKILANAQAPEILEAANQLLSQANFKFDKL